MEAKEKTPVQVAEEKHAQRKNILSDLTSLREAEKTWEKATRLNYSKLGWGTAYSESAVVTENSFGPIRAIALFYIRQQISEKEAELIAL